MTPSSWASVILRTHSSRSEVRLCRRYATSSGRSSPSATAIALRLRIGLSASVGMALSLGRAGTGPLEVQAGDGVDGVLTPHDWRHTKHADHEGHERF